VFKDIVDLQENQGLQERQDKQEFKKEEVHQGHLDPQAT